MFAAEERKRGGVVLYPSPGMGHLVSMVELGKLFVLHGMAVAVVTVDPLYNTGSTAAFISRASAANPSITFHRLPPLCIPCYTFFTSGASGFLHFCSRLPDAHGIMVNTFDALEPRALEAIAAGRCKANRAECFEWLDVQPRHSVVFLCFGSLGLFTAAQLKEIAAGLERSRQRFLWVSWVPQVEVLSHDSVGGFVTHCGWNSVLEAIVAEVPMVGWPLYAEQKMNKVFLTEEMRLAVAMDGYEEELVERTAATKERAAEALREGGSSHSALAKLVGQLKGEHQQPAAAMEVEVEAEVEGGVDRSPHVVMLSSPGMGHLIPLAEFARRLAVHHGFSVTLIATADFASSSVHRVFVDSLPPGVAFVTLPPVDVPDGMDITATISLTIVESLPALRRIVSGLKRTARLVAFVADLFGTDTFDLASEFGIPPFIFFASNLFLLSLSLHLPALHETMPRLPDPFMWLLYHLKRYEKAEGILVNSFQEMEPETAAVLKEKKPGQPPIHLIGPLVQNGGSSWSPEESLCLKWLDEQPDAGHGFLWVRTKGTGLVVSFWAPQVLILSHRAVGGFLTHCGWSSTLESAVHEVPMIAWPLYAEQRMNALMLADRLKVALRGEEGRAARERVRQLQVAATAAAAVGGTSHEALAEVVAKWKNSS
ncbi:unnamed protein product [Musa hybrid cultivar]